VKSSEDAGAEELSLSDAAEQLLEECRMVLPGIQALFGFQLVAVFSQGFESRLSGVLQRLHLGATALTSLAIALVMTPAAYHRQAAPMKVTRDFVRLSTRLLVASMLPLAASLCLELYLVGYAITGTPWIALLAALMLGLFLFLWFVLPKMKRGDRAA
jgi:hypothetical protein